MEVEVRHSPAFAVAKVLLGPGEKVQAQPGAMMAMSYGVDLQAKVEGGIMRGIGRMFSGESMHITTFTAPSQGGWVDLVPEVSGDVFVLDVEAHNPLLINAGGWLGNEMGVEVKADMNLSSAFGGEGLVILKSSGTGKIIGNAYGGLDVHSLGPGEGFTIDTGHLVAWESTVQTNVRRATGWIGSMTSKEGFVVDLIGPGDLVTQSRVPTIVTNATQSNNNFGGLLR